MCIGNAQQSVLTERNKTSFAEDTLGYGRYVVGVCMTLEYRDRYVAFVDILGFTDLIGRTTGAAPIVKLDEILSALDVPGEVQLEGIVLGRIGDISSAGHTLTSFSDCIAVSTENSEKGLMNLLFHLRAIAFRMLRLGFLVRGGIAKGKLFHYEGKVFGPAMIKAYELESMKAVYPRIIIDPAISKRALEAEPPIEIIFKRLVRENDDGYFMVHSLWAIRMAADSEDGFVGEWRTMIEGIAHFLENEAQRLVSKPKELDKIIWFKKYFDWARDRSWVDKINAPFPR